MEVPTVVQRQDFYMGEDWNPDLNVSEKLEFPKLDGVLFPVVMAHADVVAPCAWLEGEEVSLTIALNNYPYPMTEENADSVIADVRDFLQQEVDAFEDTNEVAIEGTAMDLKNADTFEYLQTKIKTVTSATSKVPELRITKKQEVEPSVQEPSTSKIVQSQLDTPLADKEPAGFIELLPELKVFNGNIAGEKIEAASEPCEVSVTRYFSEDMSTENYEPLNDTFERVPSAHIAVTVDDVPRNDLSLFSGPQLGVDLLPNIDDMTSFTEEIVSQEEVGMCADSSEHQVKGDVAVGQEDAAYQTVVQSIAKAPLKFTDESKMHPEDTVVESPIRLQQAEVQQDIYEQDIGSIDENERSDGPGDDDEIEPANLRACSSGGYEGLEVVNRVSFYSGLLEVEKDDSEFKLSSVKSDTVTVYTRTRPRGTAAARREMIDRAKVIGRSAIKLYIAWPLELRKKRQVV